MSPTLLIRLLKAPKSHPLLLIPAPSHQTLLRSLPMAKNWKLNRLTRILKRWNSSSRIHLTGETGSSRFEDVDTWHASESFRGGAVPEGFHEVYVGKSRRRYIVSSALVDHPLLRNLLSRSSTASAVDCEVVLFQHLLWMIENSEFQPESLDDLADFYAC